eukprot:CAMPEP_0113863714 /NCGR_PEP_ID=MMETSP0372-20130328/16558_1 /TAXON_ID=340204 /ORGANISM="Lankesteria abbotti" /LENGTH=52 /DNA_ID=CAMNT_0000846083 /DNA_START=21 /DNA_END=175 /DNA_ORIENTATION=+ /assembly_acc=CAM_ASM_000359
MAVSSFVLPTDRTNEDKPGPTSGSNPGAIKPRFKMPSRPAPPPRPPNFNRDS